jgi:hypothetical protein
MALINLIRKAREFYKQPGPRSHDDGYHSKHDAHNHPRVGRGRDRSTLPAGVDLAVGRGRATEGVASVAADGHSVETTQRLWAHFETHVVPQKMKIAVVS